MPSTTSAEVVLDANVIVGWLDAGDSLANRAAALLESLEERGARPLILDLCVSEALSVLCRRSRERKKEPPDLERALQIIREWLRRGEIQFTHTHQSQHFGGALEAVAASDGALNFTDALLAVFQREGIIGDVASFDAGLDAAAGFRRIS
jgi:predicted nucleic acid-binding protein